METQSQVMTKADLRELIPLRKKTDHKYSFGRVEIWGGSSVYPGALYLTALGAFKAGTGFVYLVSDVDKEIVSQLPECVWGPCPDGKEKTCVMGPGWGTDYSRVEFFNDWIESEKFSNHVTIIDGDALGILAGNSFAIEKIRNLKEKNKIILTPHEGEARRLMGVKNKMSREVLLSKLVSKFGEDTVILLKGSPNWVAYKGKIKESPWGSVAMAQAGHGDLLSGVISGLSAQGLSRFDACCLAVGVQGITADKLSKNSNLDRGVLAHEIAAEIPNTIAELKNS